MTVRGWLWSSGETGWVKWLVRGTIKFGYDGIDKGVDWEHVRRQTVLPCGKLQY